jgi:KDO2-lipid IV(A) lauroyltransferase
MKPAIADTKMNNQRPLTKKEWRTYHLLMCLFTFLGRIPRPLARKMGNFLGDAWFRLDGHHRKITLDNLALALGRELASDQRHAIATSVYRNLGQILFEIGWSLAVDRNTLNKSVTIDGLENFQAAHEQGNGVLVVTAHLGNWELLSVLTKPIGLPVNIVYRPLDFKPLDHFFEAIRSRFGAKLIPSRNALLRILKVLKRGEVVAMLLDQNVDYYDGVWVDFFGRPACTSKAMATIAQRTGAPVLPVFNYREGDGFRIVVGEILPPVVTGDRRSDTEANTARYTQVIEEGIRRKPDQWFWVHRRWKTKPYSLWPRQ